MAVREIPVFVLDVFYVQNLDRKRLSYIKSGKSVIYIQNSGTNQKKEVYIGAIYYLWIAVFIEVLLKKVH